MRPVYHDCFRFSGVNMPCERYERLVMQCAYPGSKERMVEKCWKQIEDFKECVYGLKQVTNH